MSTYDLTCIKNDVCDKAVCDYKECKNRADTIEVMKHSLQQLKAEIAALADEISTMTPKQFELNDTYIYNKLRQLSAV